ncbi:MAG TPA: hypothetical protein VFI11_09570 [Anaerolineales bacterium]|nr:hypothetical protein [Anaerolineales bacterium]
MKRSYVVAAAVVSLSTLLSLGSAPPRPALQTVVPGQRPILVLMTYSTTPYAPEPGKDFDLFFRLGNEGEAKARNIVVTFTPGDFLPRGTGGVVADMAISPDADTGYSQPMTVSPEMQGKSIGTLDMQVSYNDEDGVLYSSSFTLTIRVGKPPAPHVGPTRTPTPTMRPLLLIDSYDTSTAPLKPGTQFALTLRVRNGGSTAAKDATLVVGGGSAGSPDGTPGSGAGVSGAGGNFQTFAPLGTSNVQFLGGLAPAASISASLRMIVNNTTTPGAYPLTLSLIYTDSAGKTFTDDHVITLLVFSPPFLEVSFYRPPDPLFVGQPGTLPIQIVNLDRRSVILSRMTVLAEGAELVNHQAPIGFLDAGGYFTLDPMITTFTPGPLAVVVRIDYLDDFNEPQAITQSLAVEVLEEPMPPMGEGEGGGEVIEPLAPETFWQKVVRFFRGLLGLDSGLPQPAEPVIPEEAPPEPFPAPIGPKG